MKKSKPPKSYRKTPPASLPQKKGIKQLTADTDLGQLFDAEKHGTDQKSFADLIAEENAPLTPEQKTDNDAAAAQPSLAWTIKHSPPPQDELDLHGMTQQEAELALKRFLLYAQQARLKTVRIITGKGLHSPQGPVLRDLAETRLRLEKRQNTILAYIWDKKDKRKSGAIIVYLP